MKTTRLSAALLAILPAAALLTSAPAAAYRQPIDNDLSRCDGGRPAVRVTVTGVRTSTGNIRVQTYRATSADWLTKGRWLHRIQVPARRGTMTFCLPVSSPGSYAVAVRHDMNGNGDTDLRSDGGGMSNNPSINIFNLGKPSVSKTAFTVGNGARAIQITMRYM